MKLAWKNILHERTRFLVTTIGVAFATTLMIFQGSLLFGFLRAASKLIETTDSDIWITARGVACFDFPGPIPRRLLELARGVPGVESASRMVTGFAEYRKPSGSHQLIALVGADPEAGSRFPVPQVAGARGVLEPDAVLVDQSGAALLDVDAVPVEAEINGRRARVLGTIRGFSSFLGSPYVFAAYQDGARYLGLSSEKATYILLRLRKGFAGPGVKRTLQTRLPHVDIWTREEFARRSQTYWLAQTGAGAGILTAAILGFLIGLVVVSQTIYATTMENLEEFATLKALGASRWFMIRVVLVQAIVFALVGSAVGMAATVPLVAAAQSVIPWVFTPAWLPWAMIVPSILMCCLAALMSVRVALTVEPARVFRA